MITFKCPHCDQKVRAGDALAGKQVRCPKCVQPIQVPPVASGGPQGQSDIIKFHCPGCDQKIGLDRKYAGKTVKCSKCKTPFTVPGASQKPAPGSVVRPAPKLDIDSLLFEKQADETPGDGGPGDMFGGELLKDALGSPQAASPNEPLKLSDAALPEKKIPQVRCPRCGEMNPVEAQVCLICSFELSAKGSSRGGPLSPKRTIIVVSACSLVLIVAVIVFFALFPFKDLNPSEGPRLDEAKRLSESCINYLKANDPANVKKLFSPPLLTKVTDEQLSNMSKYINKDKIVDVNLGASYYEPNSLGDKYYLSYNIEYQTVSAGQGEESLAQLLGKFGSVIVSLREAGGALKIDGLAADNYSEKAIAFGPKSHDELSSLMLEPVFSFLQGLLKSCCAIVAAGVVLALVFVISLWVVFEKAGQPGWAAIVPFYNMWVLAEVADKPGWLGIAYCFAGGVPYVGAVASLAIFIIIALGVAKTFNRGVLFGLGLAFLPFFFYPILAFATD